MISEDAQSTIDDFMKAFHFISTASEWPHLRNILRVDQFADAKFKVSNQTGNVWMKKSPLGFKDAMFAGSLFRKFISPGEPVFLEGVVEAVRSAGIANDRVDEACHQVKKTVEQRFEVFVDPETGKSVGMHMPGMASPITWHDKRGIDDGVTTHMISTREATEVFFNEGALHAFKAKRNEETRRVIRTAPTVYQTFMAHLAISSAVYATIILHCEVSKGSKQWDCGAWCQERRIVDAVQVGDAP